MDVKEIIQNHIEPIKNDECKKLGIPQEYILSIHSYRGDLFKHGFCEPLTKNGKIVGVKIKIEEDEKRPRGARGIFHHEMKHAQQYYEDRKPSEVEAYFYEYRMGLEECIKWLYKKFRGFIP